MRPPRPCSRPDGTAADAPLSMRVRRVDRSSHRCARWRPDARPRFAGGVPAAQNHRMSYPDPRYRRTRGELSAVYRTVDTGSQLTVRLKTEVHYLATGAVLGGGGARRARGPEAPGGRVARPVPPARHVPGLTRSLEGSAMPRDASTRPGQRYGQLKHLPVTPALR